MIVSKLNTIFVGRFKNGVLHGFGAKLYPKGNYFIGHFIDGKQHGLGREKEAGQPIKNGQWQNDQFNN